MRCEDAGVLVTGGASGLGLATALHLARAGSCVVSLDIAEPDPAGRAEDRSGRVSWMRGDVTSEEDVSAAVALAARAEAGLRAVVSCAAVLTAAAVVDWSSAPHPLDEFERTVRNNLLGTFNVLRLAAAQMAGQPPLDGERGVVVNTTSIAASDGQRGQCAYAASKAAIEGLTLPAARDLSPRRIRVATVAPGLFDTPMLADVLDPVKQPLVKQVQCPARLGHPDEFAALVRHVIENQMINGTVLRIDGGLRLPP